MPLALRCPEPLRLRVKTCLETKNPPQVMRRVGREGSGLACSFTQVRLKFQVR